jgi:hypothetical protein
MAIEFGRVMSRDDPAISYERFMEIYGEQNKFIQIDMGAVIGAVRFLRHAPNMMREHMHKIKGEWSTARNAVFLVGARFKQHPSFG